MHDVIPLNWPNLLTVARILLVPVLVVVLVRWISDTRRDIAALPEEHH